MRKFFKILLYIALFLAVAIPAAIYYNLQESDAPILKGELEYNLEYKPGLALDIYEPTQKVFDKTPLLIHYHGGAWITGSKISVNNDRFNGAFNTLRDQGYAILSPDYTLAEYGKSPFPACLEDAYDVLQWVKAHGEEYNFDFENIGIMGESAGGHIALMSAYHEQYQDTAQDRIQLNYVVDVYGPTSLYQLYVDQIPLLDSVDKYTISLPECIRENFDINQYLFGFDPAEDEQKSRAFADPFSPAMKVRADLPPTLMIHGNSDQVVPMSQSEILKVQLDSFRVHNEFHVLEGVDHAFMDATEPQHEQIQDWISTFVVAQYRS